MAKDQPKALATYEVLLCITGGIACYKSADLASKLVQAGAGVTVAMTEAACRFITPLTFQSLTHRQTFTDIWQSSEGYNSQHISLTERADLMIIAPATANTLGKIAGGIADNLVTCLALSASGECPILLAPAMNVRMWSAPAMVANMDKLRQWSLHVVGPAEGYLACGTVGLGRMSESSDIFQTAMKLLLSKPPKKR